MITLYKYLRESIFDDEEEILDNTVTTVLLNELTSKLFRSRSLNGKTTEDICKIENKTLYINAKFIYGFADFSQYTLPIFKKLKELTEIDRIESDYNISISYDKKLDPSILCETIKAASIVIYYTPSISDINFELYNDGGFNSAIKFYGMDSLDLKNITVNTPKVIRKHPAVYFEFIPNISNCKFNGINVLYIENPSLFNDETLKKKLDNFFDSKHEAFYVNPKKGPGNIKRSSKWIKLKATINNSKLEFISSNNNKIFDILPNAKLSDIININMFPDLEYVYIRDADISIGFNKNGKDYKHFRNSPNVLQLPNDPEWTVGLHKIG